MAVVDGVGLGCAEDSGVLGCAIGLAEGRTAGIVSVRVSSS